MIVPQVGQACSWIRPVTQPPLTRKNFPHANEWLTCPVSTVLSTCFWQNGHWYRCSCLPVFVFTSDFGGRGSSWLAALAVAAAGRTEPVKSGARSLQLCMSWVNGMVVFCSVFARISRRTSSIMACWRRLASRRRNGVNRWFARRAIRHTKARLMHALQRCVPFWLWSRLACQAVNSACGFRSKHSVQDQCPRSFWTQSRLKLDPFSLNYPAWGRRQGA